VKSLWTNYGISRQFPIDPESLIWKPFSMSANSDYSRSFHRFVQAISVVTLLFFAGMLHLHEVPAYHHWWTFCIWGSLLLYPIYLFEVLALLVQKQAAWKRHLVYLIVPPLRLMAPYRETGEVWLPRLGWTNATETLGDKIEHVFALPMIFVAVLILPVIGIEYFYESEINANSTYHLGVNLATCLIWLAFTVEFVVVMSLHRKKWRYCKEHWLDLAIILLPLIAFLRAVRLARLAQLPRLSKTVRIYRMRGMFIKLQRAVLMMSIVKRILHARPEARLKSLEEKLREKDVEISLIREEIKELHRIIEVRDERERLVSESELA
jgi:voltage-gated potassium channel